MTSADIDQLVAGQTVANQFLATVQRHGDRTALRWRNDDDSWGSCTWSEYATQVGQVAAGLAAMGVGKGDRVVLMMRNIWQFHVADVAAYFLGATPVSIYNSSAPDQVEYLVNHCEASYGIVEDAGFLAKFQAVRDQLTTLKGLAIVKDPDGSVGSEIVHWDTLYSHGSIDLEAAADAAQPDDLATLIYTSGTTGPPKAVMISHHNIAWQVESLRQCITQHPEFQGELAGKKLVSYLPMAHIAERMVSHYQGVFLGYEVTTCPEPTLIAEYLREVHPNVVFGVPRCGEDLRRRQRRARRRPRPQGAVRRRRRCRHGDRVEDRLGHRHRGGAGHLGVPPGRLRHRARPHRPRRVRAGHHRGGADPGRAAGVVPCHRRAVGRGLRHVGEHRRHDLHPDPR
ncbi:MAG: AMP-binding protein [Acidimicrobiales bacterium]